MPLSVFFRYGIIVAILEYGTLLFAGYFLGTSLGGTATRVIDNVQYAIAFFAVAVSAYYFFSWYIRGKFLKTDKEIEDIPA